MWSLGNEAGYGAAHDAMAAYLRRVDPTRPVHYEVQVVQQDESVGVEKHYSGSVL